MRNDTTIVAALVMVLEAAMVGDGLSGFWERLTSGAQTDGSDIADGSAQRGMRGGPGGKMAKPQGDNTLNGRLAVQVVASPGPAP